MADVASKLGADRAYIAHAAGIMRTFVQLDPETQRLYNNMIGMKSKQFLLGPHRHACEYFAESHAGALFNSLSCEGLIDILY